MSRDDDNLSKVERGVGILAAVAAIWDRVMAWRKGRSFNQAAKAELDAKKRQLEQQVLRKAEDAADTGLRNTGAPRCPHMCSAGKQCVRPRGHIGAHRGE